MGREPTGTRLSAISSAPISPERRVPPDDPRHADPYRHRRTPAPSPPTSQKAQIMTLLLSPPSLPDTLVAAATARDAVKTYGNGATAVRALDGVDVDFAVGEFTAI